MKKQLKDVSLYDLLKREIKRMAVGIGEKGQGNIYPLIVGEVERYLIDVILNEVDFNCVSATRLLGISRSTLYRKMEEFKMRVPKNKPIVRVSKRRARPIKSK